MSTAPNPNAPVPANKGMLAVLIGLLGLLVAAFVFFQPKPQPVTPSEFHIYFGQARGSDMVVNPVKRDFKAPLEDVVIERRIKWAIEQLLAGPTPDEAKNGFLNEIPTGTEVKKVYAQGDDIYVELTPKFADSGGANSLQQRVSQLTETIKAVPGLKNPVHLMIDGKVATVLGGEGLEIDDPLVPAPH